MAVSPVASKKGELSAGDCAHLLAVGWGTHVFSVFDARTSACVAHFGGEGRPSPGR